MMAGPAALNGERKPADAPSKTPASASAAPVRRFAAGNQANLRRLQAKLTIGAANDPLEREADAAADRVMRMADPQISTPATPTLSRKCETCEEEEEKHLQREAGGGGMTSDLAPPIVDAVLSSPGHALDPAAHGLMSSRFGTDFSDVRIHTDAQAAQSAAAVGARAYTVGHDIVFGAGQYNPIGDTGRHLLAHELAHVIQQQQTPPRLARAPANREAAAIGSGIEPMELKDWKAKLEAEGYEVYTRTQFDRVEWLAKAFSDRRARPDLVAVNRAKRHVLVGDVTAGPWSQTDLKPGDRRKLPHDIGAEPETKAHLEKTVENARQAQKNLPEELRGFSVGAQDRWWSEGKLSREVVVAKGTPKPNPPHSTPASPAGGAPAAGAQPKPPSEAPAASQSRPPAEVPTVSMPKAEPAGGGARATPAAPKSAEAPKTTAIQGEPIKPVNEATPGYDPHGSGIGGAIQMIQAAQFAGLQQAEVDKLQARLATLLPKVDALLQRGSPVELILIVEKPDVPDLSCAAGIYCEQGQIVYFRELFISRIWNPQPVPKAPAITTYPTIGPTGGRDSHVPFTHEGGSLTDESEIRFLPAKHADHHCEYAKERWDPKPGLAMPKSTEPDLTTPDQVKGIIGTYKGEFREMFAGSIYDLSQLTLLGRNRSLKIEMAADGRAKPTMTLYGLAYSFLDTGTKPPRVVSSGRFAMDQGIPLAVPRYRSSLASYPEHGIILEWAHGLDSDLNDTWDALFKWQRL